MKKFLNVIFAGALTSAMCVGFVACDGNEPKPTPGPEETKVKTEFVVINGLEYPSDIFVDLKDGHTSMVASGEKDVIHSYSETTFKYNEDGTPMTKVPYEEAIPEVKMMIYGRDVPDDIWDRDCWELSGEDVSDESSDVDYVYTVTLTVTNELLTTLNGPEPYTYVTENYNIVNLIASDIVVKLKFGDEQVTTIEPGDEQWVGSRDYLYEWGIAYSRDGVLYAEMTVDGEIIPYTVWNRDENWERVREDGEDDYHYALRYTLTVTDELLETARKEAD